MNREHLRVVDQLLWRRAHGERSSDKLVDWAAGALAGGLDSPHLRILAGLTAPHCWSEIEDCFSQVLQDFGLSSAEPGEALINEIREVFPTGPLPKRPVTGHRCHECDKVDEQLGGRSWKEVAECLPDWCDGAFPLLTTEAGIYYLPAYLEYGLHEPESIAGYSVECALRRGDFQRDTFTQAQRGALSAWIEFRAMDPIHDDTETLVANPTWLLAWS